MPACLCCAACLQSLTLDDADVAVEIWDTAGQERYRSLAPMYYRGAQAAIIVFDITSRESFEGAKTWTKELQRRTESGSMIVALCGNKTDLAHLRRVDSEEGVAFAREAGLLYVETSAKDATNVERLFIEVAKRVPRAASAAAAAAKKDAVALGGSGTGGSASGGGCC